MILNQKCSLLSFVTKYTCTSLLDVSNLVISFHFTNISEYLNSCVRDIDQIFDTDTHNLHLNFMGIVQNVHECKIRQCFWHTASFGINEQKLVHCYLLLSNLTVCRDGKLIGQYSAGDKVFDEMSEV